MDTLMDKWALEEEYGEYSPPDVLEQPPEWGFNYLSITHDDMLNGDGLRTVLWVSGCSHSCPGCQNAYSWDGQFGRPFTEESMYEMFSYIGKDYTEGVTFSGGDPLFIFNRQPLGALAKEIKKSFPNKSLWVYTGYELEYDSDRGFYFKEAAPWKKAEGVDEFSLDWLGYIDVLVDRPYLESVRKEDIKNGYDPEWVGSSNQRVIEIPASLEAGRIIERRR